MTVFIPIANLINLIIENWMISVAALAVFASLCLGLFKGAKHGIRAMSILLVLAIIGLCAFLVYYFIAKDLEGLIKFGIAWLPTIIFLIVIILSTLVGIRRGLRKSLILVLHAVIAAGICLGLFFFCVTSPVFDKLLLNIINSSIGTGGLQSQLGVSAECSTVREVLLELFNSYAIEWGEIGILLGETSAYVLALVNMVYRLIFAIVFYLLYQFLLLILYIIYLIFYSERKYKNKRNISFAMNQADSSYKKRPLGGGCVGLVRGLVSGIISLSFLGTVFYIAVGGSGASRLPENISFGENYNPLISIYRSIESYGDQGIFKILNSIDDPKNTPYYLFAADIVFSGGLDDEERGVSGNIKFREELAAYTGFAKNTLALLIKYDTDGDVSSILRGDGGGDTMDKLLKVFTKSEFRVEFDNLIDNFDAQTYIINFSLSLADAVISNVDEMSFMESVSADNKELLKVLFKRNYLSDTIPDERDRKHSVSSEVTEEEEIPPYLTVNHLFTKRDARIVLGIVLDILANNIDVGNPHSIATNLIPNIEELSILSTKRSHEMDPVLGRLYCFLDNKYLTDDGEDGITYAEVKDESVYWTRELRALLSVADGLLTMYDKVTGSEDKNIFTAVTSLFDEENEDYNDNVKMYEELTDVISDSKILSKVMCSNKVHSLLNDQLRKVSENIYFPKKLIYENTYDDKGNLISHGEAYQILRGLRLLAEKDNKEIMDSLLESSSEFKDLIKKLSQIITKDDPNAHGNSLASYLTESTLLRSVISSVIQDRAGDMLVVPTLSLETIGEQPVNIINKAELREIFEALPELIDLILPLASEDVGAEHINAILEDKTFKSLLDNGNKIVEGTIAKSLIEMLVDNGTVIISKKLENYEEWITVSGDPGELRKFLRTIDLLAIDIKGLMEGEGLDGTKIFDKLKTLEEDRIYELLDSEVFYYTSSKMLNKGEIGFTNFTVIVPTSACRELENDTLDRIIKKDELASVFIDLKEFGLSSDMNSENIIKKLVEKKEILDDSNIISASVVNFLVSNEDICTALSIPKSYIDDGKEEKLKEYDMSNLWHSELPHLIGAIDEIFGISNLSDNEEFVFNSEKISEKTNSLLMSLNDKSISEPKSSKSRLDVCYLSEIIQNNITTELDKALDDELIEEEVLESLKIINHNIKVYPQSEISALVSALKALGINSVDDAHQDNFSSLGNYKNNIDVLCKSGIVRGIITKKIDESLNGDIIDSPVKKQIKGGNMCYSAEEITDLVNALDELGMQDFNDLDKYDFSKNITNLKNTGSNGTETKLEIIYRSDIVAGILTKSVRDTFDKNEDLVYHTAAHRSDLDVLKLSEIDSLLSLLDTDDLDNFKVGAVSLLNVRDQLVPDTNGHPRSYLILANFTDTIIKNTSLYIPSSVYETRSAIVKASEAVHFIDAIIALHGSDETLDDWDVDGDLVLPEEEHWNTLLGSEIMRATFSHTVFTANKDIAFSKSSINNNYYRVTKSGVTQNKIAIISNAQFKLLFEIIGTSGNELKVPSFTDTHSIRESNLNIELLYKFDVTRYTMSKAIVSDPTQPGVMGLCEMEEFLKFDSNGNFIESSKEPVVPFDILEGIVKAVS